MERKQRMRTVLASPWVICAVALAVRLMALAVDAGGYAGRPSYPIGTEIGRIAHSLVIGEGFSSPFSVWTGPTAWVAPVYPWLLAAAYKILGLHTFAALVAILIFNCVCSALTALPLCAIARDSFGMRVAAWSGWLWALLPSLVNFPVRWVWETSLSALLLTTMLWLAVKTIQDSKFKIQNENIETLQAAPARMWLAFGVTSGVAGLTNPALLAPVPFLLMWAAWQSRGHGAERARQASPLRNVATAAVVCALVIAPWLIRNYIVFERFVFIRSNAGVELWLGNNPQVEDSWTFWLHPSDSKEELTRFRRIGEAAYTAEKQRDALWFIAANPGKFTRLSLNRFVYFWMGTWDSLVDLWAGARLWPAVNATIYGALALLGLAGLVVALRKRTAEAGAFGIVLLMYPLVYYVTHPILRFRHPVDAALVILAVVAVGRAIEWWRKGTPGAAEPMLSERTI